VTHSELCIRAVRWLRGTRRCNPVYSLNASCAEIPDAIGWSSAHGWYGSTIIECKTSLNDFYADQKKRYGWKHPDYNWHLSADRFTLKRAKEAGYERVDIPLMGDFRFYLCDAGLLLPELVSEKAPDHGLIYRDGKAMRIIRPAPRREQVDKDAEIRYLRFAIINGKTGREIEEREEEKPEPVLDFAALPPGEPR
jgi:hypothetical protein